MHNLYLKIVSAILTPFVSLGALFAPLAPVIVYVPQEAPSTVAGATLPTGTAVFETSLQSAITSSATSMTLTANAIRGGGALAGYDCFTLDEGSAQAETVCGTVSGTTVSSMSRGISQATGTTTVAALQFGHRRGANVKKTDFPLIQILKAQNNGEDTFANTLSYASSVGVATSSTQIPYASYIQNNYVDKFGSQTISGVKTFTSVPILSNGVTITPAPTNGTDGVNKTYADGLAAAGCANSAPGTKGCVEQATVAQINAATATGGTGAKLFISPDLYAVSNLASTTVYYATSTSSNTPLEVNGISMSAGSVVTMTGNEYISASNCQSAGNNFSATLNLKESTFAASTTLQTITYGAVTGGCSASFVYAWTATTSQTINVEVGGNGSSGYTVGGLIVQKIR